jgi:hypothetical protein
MVLQFKTNTSERITATHTTPVKKYVDDLSFDLSGSNSTCQVKVRHTPLSVLPLPLPSLP